MRDKPAMRALTVTLALALLVACGRDDDRSASPPAAADPELPAEPVPAASADATAQRANPADDAAPSEEPVAPAADASAHPPEWEPSLTPTTSDTLADTLHRAEAAEQAGRYEEGEDNALDLYLSVLESEPGNEAATAGVERVVQNLAARIEAALADRRYDDASAAARVLRKLRGSDVVAADLVRRADDGRKLGEMLADAARLVRDGQILDPPQQNAATLYAQVLLQDAGHPVALAGLAAIETDLVASATAAAEAGDYARSDKLLADAARVRPGSGSGSVQDASTQIVELRQDRASELLQQAQAAASHGDVRRAEQLQQQLEQVSAQSQGIEELRVAIAQARIYGGAAPGQRLSDALTIGGTGPELVVIPIGSFEMGSSNAETERKKNEGPQHRVTLPHGIAIARTEVSVAQFAAFVQATGYVTSAEQSGRSTIYDERSGGMADRKGVDWRQNHAGRKAEPGLPVVHVSWNDATAYADWLSRESGKTYALPSEAVFEYVLRAGSSARYPWGDGDPVAPVGNLTGERDRSASKRSFANAFPGYGDGYWGAAPVGAFPASRFGVHDANGNVSEWVEDCWHDSYSRAPADGTAWVNPGCGRRVIRGASWASAPDQVRSAFRFHAEPTASNARVGFRVVRGL